MKPHEENPGQLVDRHLRLFNAPAPEQIANAQTRALESLRAGAGDLLDEAAEEVAIRPPSCKWRMAFAGATAAGILLFITLAPRGSDAYAMVQTPEGRTYKVGVGEPVRSTGEGTVVKLPSGATVEMRANSEVWLEQAPEGVRLRLNIGIVNVNAPEQGIANSVLVRTKDATVNVAGAESLISAAEAGTRVAVRQGEVRVQQRGTETTLRPGEQLVTNPSMPKLVQQDATRPVDTPKWEAISIRPCTGDIVPGARGGGTPGTVAAGGVSINPGLLRVTCMRLRYLMEDAYVKYLEPEAFRRRWIFPVTGGPEWLDTDLYTIEAKPEGNPDHQMMGGPMLQTLLEDRFKLKLRREVREEPIYELRVAEEGLKLQPLKDGECEARNSKRISVEGLTVEEALAQFALSRECGQFRITNPKPGVAREVNLIGLPLRELTNYLSLDRIILDKTGIPGLFDITVSYDANLSPMREPLPPMEPSGKESIFKEIEKQLGLKLVPTLGPRTYYFVEHVERPNPN